MLPDDWILPSELNFTPGNSAWGNTYTTDQWKLMEANGAVFLPAAGQHVLNLWQNPRANYIDFSNTIGRYWSLSGDANGEYTEAYTLYIKSSSVQFNDQTSRDNGLPVRLVRVLN